jgi:hypothetical protein
MATLMFSYGSNLNVDEMARRCPAAVPIGEFQLPGWRLVFRGVADIIREEGAVCYGGIWCITPACERTLDVYEGVASGVYRREFIPIKSPQHGTNKVLIYTMTSTGIFPPSVDYLNVIRQGYRDFNIPEAGWHALSAAVRESWDDKAPSFIELRRYRRDGHPTLAVRPKAAEADDQ